MQIRPVLFLSCHQPDDNYVVEQIVALDIGSAE